MRTVKTFILAAAVLVLLSCAPTVAKKTVDTEKDPQYQYEKGVIAWRYGLADEALRYAELAVSLDPRHALAQNLLGLVQAQKGNINAAVAAFEKAVEAKPDFADAYTNLGNAYLDMLDMTKAGAAYQKAIDLDENYKATYGLARVLYEQKKYEEALAAVMKSIAKFNRLASAYNLQGILLTQLNRHAESVWSFESAFRLAPEDVTVRINLGLAYVNNKELDKGRLILERVLPLIKDPAVKEKVEDYLKQIRED
ncbi:MAG: tetratricopeptide repeat protein [Candidatus Aminicenantes bacterium]|nr:tetratricopeptide repeat protein [Candidatus Aminicenantes bacterium]